jgi:hypothetical protein
MAGPSEAEVLIRRIIEQRLEALSDTLDRNAAVPVTGPARVYRRSESTGEYQLVMEPISPEQQAREDREAAETTRLDEIQREMKWAIERALRRILPKYPGVKRSELLDAIQRSFPPETGLNAEPLFDRDLVRQAHSAVMRERGFDARSADAELAQALDVSARTVQAYRLAAAQE